MVTCNYLGNPFEPKIENESAMAPDTLMNVLRTYADIHKERYPFMGQNKVMVRINEGEPLSPDFWDGFIVRDGDRVEITDALEGGNRGGLINVVIGAVIIVGSVIYGYYTGDWYHAGMGIQMGVGFMLGGAVSLLTTAATPSYGMTAPGGIRDLSVTSPTYAWSDEE